MIEVKKIIEQSLRDLYLNDNILINRYTKEESINHWLAIYIDKNIKNNLEFEYNVDVEYNRNVTDELFDRNRQINNKKIVKWSVNDITWQEIIPDIIVHKRGSNENNYLCIEVKKEYQSRKSANVDLQKIIGLLNKPFDYKYGCIIEYKPEDEYFEVTIIRKVRQEYESELFFVEKILPTLQ